MTASTAALGAVTLSGNITGSGGLVVASSGNPANTALFGKGVLTLSGANTYAGDTTVERGTLRLTQAPDPANANTGNDTSTVTIAATGATLDLAYAGTDIVGKFYTGTIRRPDGVYGHGNSGATNGGLGVGALDAYFGSGSGTLTVVAPGFTSWMKGAFANGQVPVDQRGPNDDFDKDGISNLIEYAIDGHDPTVANPIIGNFDGETLFFSKREGTLGLTYAIEESTDLGVTDPWEEATGVGYLNQPTAISHTFSPGSPARSFARLRITQVP
jgi:autotransporter-associated beta strand protein